MLRSLWGALGDGIERRMQEPDTEVMSDMLEALEEIIEMLEPALLPMEKLAAICEKLQGILADSAKRRAEAPQAPGRGGLRRGRGPRH